MSAEQLCSRKKAVAQIAASDGRFFTVVFWKKPAKASASDMEKSCVDSLLQCPRVFVGLNKESHPVEKVIMNIGGKFMVREKRVMTCRKGVRWHLDENGEIVGLKGVGMAYNPKDYGLMNVFDLKVKNYRMINKYTLIAVHVGGVWYKVSDAYNSDGTLKPATTVDL